MRGPTKDAQGLITEPGDMVLYAAGFPAVHGKQPLYFQDPVFQARAAVPAPMRSDTLRSATPLPSPATLEPDDIEL
jgi:type IV secretion system protein VirD4